MFVIVSLCFFFFKQKTAYEMRISDWSSDVCSSDLPVDCGPDDRPAGAADHRAPFGPYLGPLWAAQTLFLHRRADCQHGAVRDAQFASAVGDRKSVGSGKGVSVRVDLGGRRIIKKKKTKVRET